MILLKLLFLIVVANGAPIIARKLFACRMSFPLDAGLIFIDGNPLLGRAKTVRGITASLVCTPLFALFINIPFLHGLIIACCAMVGDVISSFVKRRIGLETHAMALGIDQVPESFLPLFIIKNSYSLTYFEIFLVVFIFMVFEKVISQILYKLHMRNQPY